MHSAICTHCFLLLLAVLGISVPFSLPWRLRSLPRRGVVLLSALAFEVIRIQFALGWSAAKTLFDIRYTGHLSFGARVKGEGVGTAALLDWCIKRLSPEGPRSNP